MFKGKKLNEKEGETIKIIWRKKKDESDTVNFSKKDMQRMEAEPGDLVYLCDARWYLGGLKSIHTVYGEPHEEDGVVYLNKDHLMNSQFVEGKYLTAEKEM
jgi:SSS family solute:Na+ symporter